MSGASSPVVIAICGNPDAGDDALGPLVARQLGDVRPGVRIVHVGTDATWLLDHLSEAAAVIVVDAVRCRGLPRGELVDLDWRSEARAGLLSASAASSTHGIGLDAVIDLAERLEMLPRHVRLIGVVIEDAVLGDEVDQTMRNGVRRACARIEAHVGRLVESKGLADA